jgi:hypothetical protein
MVSSKNGRITPAPIFREVWTQGQTSKASGLLLSIDNEPDRLDDEIGLMDLNVVVAAGGEDVRGIRLELDQVFGTFEPIAFQARRCKVCEIWRHGKRFPFGEHDKREAAQGGGPFNLDDASVNHAYPVDTQAYNW